MGLVSASRLADSAAVDGVNSARIYTTYFGPLPQSYVAITQQAQWSFGQSWPSLIFLPYASFLTSTQRAALGLMQMASFVNRVGFHEFAHQLPHSRPHRGRVRQERFNSDRHAGDDREATVPIDVKLKLPKAPKRVLVNSLGQVLARD